MRGVKLSEMRCACLRCGHGWLKRVESRPVRCPGCKQPHWDIKTGVLKMGRPKKKAGKKRAA
jgi:Zn finger protein HypA/HybF involved in hydrogenase expression